jgi:hypothetical protein
MSEEERMVYPDNETLDSQVKIEVSHNKNQ